MGLEHVNIPYICAVLCPELFSSRKPQPVPIKTVKSNPKMVIPVTTGSTG